jgi:hypothetical protein
VGPPISPLLLPRVKKVKNKIKTDAVTSSEPTKPVKKSEKEKEPVSDPAPVLTNQGAGWGKVTCMTFLTLRNMRKKLKNMRRDVTP